MGEVGASLRVRGNNNTATNTKSTPPAPVILGLVPRIFWQQDTNLVNKLALLLNKYRLREDSWDKPKNDGCWGRRLSTFSQSGRSMIEMLGVLAIIGVLSVGGIAGYSKAMEKFKFNKAMSEYSTLMFGVVQHLDDFKHAQIKGASYTPLGDIAVALDMVPPTWQESAGYRFIDGLGNLIQIFIRDTGELSVDFYLSDRNTAKVFNNKLCREILQNLTIPLHGSVIKVWGTGSSDALFYGDAYCDSNSQKCFSQITLADVNDFCSLCSSSICMIVFNF